MPDESSQLQHILITNNYLKSLDANSRRALLNNCDLEPYCNLVDFDKPLGIFIPNLCSELSKANILVDESNKLGLIVFLECLILSDFLFRFTSEEQVFLEKIVQKWKKLNSSINKSELPAIRSDICTIPKYLQSPELPLNFLKRSDNFNTVKTRILGQGIYTVEETASLPKVGIWGMSGVGKSVLAAWLAQDEEVKSAFPDGVFWLTIGVEPKLTLLQLRLAKELGGTQDSFEDEQQGKNYLSELLADKACLVILDDVWHINQAIAFDALGSRCQMLITTQDVEVIRALGATEHRLEELDKTHALELLAKWVRTEVNELPPEAQDVAQECGNLPLALSLCGAMVRDGVAWTDLLEALQEADLSFIEKQQFRDYPNPNVLKALKVSVDALIREDPICAQHYQELDVFPADETIPEVALQTLWLRDGKAKERHARKWMNRLKNRALLQVSGELHKPQTKLHSLQYKYLLAVQDDLPNLHNQLLEAYSQKCSSGWSTAPNDGYFFQHLAYHLVKSGRIAELRNLQFNFNWLQAKLENTDVNAVIADFDFLPDDKDCQLVQSTLRLSAHILAQDKKQLAGQLLGRLLSYNSSKIQALLEQVKQWKAVPWLRPLTPSLLPPEGALLRTLMGHSSSIKGVAVTPDGKRAVSASSDEVIVWDIETGTKLNSLYQYMVSVEAIAITPDGKHIILAFQDFTELLSHYCIKVLDLDNGAELRAWVAHEQSINAIAVTPDGLNIISASNDDSLKIWDLKSGFKVCTLIGHTMPVEAVAVTTDGLYVISGSKHGTVRVWDLKSGKIICTLDDHNDVVTAVAVTPDGEYIVSGSWDKTVKVWDWKKEVEICTFEGHTELVRTVTVLVTPDGQYVISGDNDGKIKIWNFKNPLNPLILAGHTTTVRAVAVTIDGKYLVSGSEDNTVKVWNLESQTEQFILSVHKGSVRAVTVAPSGRYAVSASNDKTIRVWSLQNQIEVIQTMEGHTDCITSLVLMPDEQRIISASHDATLRIWDLSGRLCETLIGHDEGITAIAITSDGKIAISASLDKTFKIWDLETGQQRCSFPTEDENVSALAVIPDSRYVISDFDKTHLKVWDLNNGTKRFILSGHRSYVTTVTVTPDGKYAISGAEDDTIIVWDLKSGDLLFGLYAHTAAVTAVAVTQDSKYILSTSRDHTLKVWDFASRSVIASFSGDSTLHACAVAPDGVAIVAGEESGQLHFLFFEKLQRQPLQAKSAFKALLVENQSEKTSKKGKKGFRNSFS